jgi:transposase-like protein
MISLASRRVKREPNRRHRFPPEVISAAVWRHFRLPLSRLMVKEMPAAHAASTCARRR